LGRDRGRKRGRGLTSDVGGQKSEIRGQRKKGEGRKTQQGDESLSPGMNRIDPFGMNDSLREWDEFREGQRAEGGDQLSARLFFNASSTFFMVSFDDEPNFGVVSLFLSMVLI